MSKLNLFKIKGRTDIRGIYKTTLIVFVLLSLVGTIPYLASGVLGNFADALFESVSGFTTTGATCITREARIPAWIIVYRSLTQWIGGGLVLVFLAATLKSFDSDSSINTDGNAAPLYRTGIRFHNIVIRLLSTYGAMTASAFAALLATKTDPLISLVYALSIVSTGGRGIGDWYNFYLENNVQTVVLIFMVLSCINYTIYYHIIKKHFDRISKSTELFAYLMFLVVGSAIVVASLSANGSYEFRDAVHIGIFEAVSHATTTGINIADISEWPALAKLILSGMTFTGGSTASLGSGIKIIRVVILAKLIARSFIYRIHPNAVVAIKMNGKPVSDAVQKSVISYFLVLAAFFIAGAFLISFDAYTLEETLHITSYLINNAGGGIVSGYSSFTKIVMCILMLAGRLEFYALLIPFTKEN